MNTLAPLLDPCPHTGFSSLGNTHWYSARSDNPVREQISALSSQRFMNIPGSPGLIMNTLAPLLDPCPHTGFSSLGNTHWYSARSENPVCGQCSAQSSRRFMNNPGLCGLLIISLRRCQKGSPDESIQVPFHRAHPGNPVKAFPNIYVYLWMILSGNSRIVPSGHVSCRSRNRMLSVRVYPLPG